MFKLTIHKVELPLCVKCEKNTCTKLVVKMHVNA